MVQGIAESTMVVPEEASEHSSETKERVRIEARFEPLLRQNLALGKLVSYVQNKKVPFLRLYRYKEAFSLAFVNYMLDKFGASPQDVVFDPFAGMGTTLWAAMHRGIRSIGVDRLPIAAFVAQTLPKFHSLQSGELTATFNQLRAKVDQAAPAEIASDVPLMKIAFDAATLLYLRRWKAVIEELPTPLRDVFRLLFFSILVDASYTSNDGQFLRLKRSKQPTHPDRALQRKVLDAETDLIVSSHQPDSRIGPAPEVFVADARDLEGVELRDDPTVLITSPPYVNRYDYTRSYCLELCFHFVSGFVGLRSLRHSILRSHIESRVNGDDKPCHPVVDEVVQSLMEQKLNNPRIPYMLIAYFVDMDKCIQQWGRVLATGGRVAMVVDNVRFQGELVPVDLVLSEIAERHGFVVEDIIVARFKGNSSQQMGRYGRVPVRESVVIWRRC